MFDEVYFAEDSVDSSKESQPSSTVDIEKLIVKTSLTAVVSPSLEEGRVSPVSDLLTPSFADPPEMHSPTLTVDEFDEPDLPMLSENTSSFGEKRNVRFSSQVKENETSFEAKSPNPWLNAGIEDVDSGILYNYHGLCAFQFDSKTCKK